MQTKTLADFLTSVKWEQLDDATINYAKMCVQDFLGVALAGSTAASSKILRKYFAGVYPAGPCTILDSAFAGVSPYAAAAANAAYGHAMDLDDLHNSSICHLGVITIPTAVALSQSLQKSGKDLLLAVVLGYEAGARIGEAINPSAYWYWHTTSLVGNFASGTVAGHLLGLSGGQMQHCFGSAGTQAGGLWAFLSNGSMSKCLHVANANLCGMRSAELACLGFTGAADILENERGFVRAVAPEYDLDRITDGLGASWKLNSNSFKPYACCRHTHSADYGILKLSGENGFGPKDIVSIRDDTYQTATETTDNPNPQNAYAAKFSLQYCIAAALVFGRLDQEVFTAENLQNPEVRVLMRRIQVRADPGMEEIHKNDPNRWVHRLTVSLADGRIFTEKFQYPLGDFNNPFDWEMADAKFLRITKGVLPGERAGELIQRLHRLDEWQNVSALFDFSISGTN